ncbi:MAG: hypothetical protein Q9184_006804 [Pyrenodesmia sp. 2 TL-2023]
MKDESLAHDSMLDLGVDIATKVLRNVEQAVNSEVYYSFPASTRSRINIDSASLRFVTFRSNQSLDWPVFVEFYSLFPLPISVGVESEMIYYVKIELNWIMTPADRDHHLQGRTHEHNARSASAPLIAPRSSRKDIFPYYHAFRYIVNFIESKPHTNFDMMAYEASEVAFKACEEGLGPRQIRTVRISVSDLGPEQPAEGTTWKIKQSWIYDSQWYSLLKRARNDIVSSNGSHRALIALGSNIGDRIGMVEQACTEMAQRGLKPLRTSSLYETEPMYKTDQPSFVNGVCEIETTSSPPRLLNQLQDIETSLGRVKTVANGPRTIDLDILTYDDRIVDVPWLQIPHPRISEREFVLRPLCDIVPHSFLPPPNTLLDFSSQLAVLPFNPNPLSPQTPLTRFGRPSTTPDTASSDTPKPVITSTLPTRKTHLMAILNLTPDSFSSDGLHTPTFSPSSLLPTLRSLLAHSVTILDIGGESTRPHATPLSPSDELTRVLPTVQYIRSLPEFNPLILCIDTYHASVARACIDAGADIINDISAGQLDTDMFPTVAELGCTYIMMHMRGTPETMNTLTSYPTGVVEGIASELNQRVQEAMAAGIRRWRLILDPGIGFAKTGEQNLEVLRRLPELRGAEGLKGLPWCLGVSRKAFVGKVTGAAEMGERVWGTAGAVAACVQGGADMVRVHDWGEMGKVARMADAVWRV